ncbi:hypothetical protein BUALT_Bualt01G0096900 [Buddleja alternifolia]|uniref:Uncharacterized protein n=1 Tax=Buddleja alternifolia TaxID=168488 RepID=A0AAV6YBS3_9LAMI|nr:hypothetical protein BUALT_Bualt01G0096900 [Buddleja alternifolia]
MFIIVYLKIHIFFLIYYFQLTCILRLACFSLVPRTGKMVSTNRRPANASSSTTPHLSLSQVGESVPQGSLSPSQPDVNILQTPSSGAVEEAIRNKPSFGGLTQRNWETLCTTLFNDPKYQERCNINKQNRSKMTTNHNQGSRSFVVARHMLSQEPEFEGDEVDRINLHKHTHYIEGKRWITPQSENNHVEMEKRRIDAETRGEAVDVDKIVDDVLGKRLSYIVGLGYGPKPNKSSSGMRILQETLKEKDRECAELREERAALMEEMNAMKSTLAEHTRLFEKLVQSQNLSSPW